jgi:hypothetical protein
MKLSDVHHLQLRISKNRENNQNNNVVILIIKELSLNINLLKVSFCHILKKKYNIVKLLAPNTTWLLGAIIIIFRTLLFCSYMPEFYMFPPLTFSYFPIPNYFLVRLFHQFLHPYLSQTSRWHSLQLSG